MRFSSSTKNWLVPLLHMAIVLVGVLMLTTLFSLHRSEAASSSSSTLADALSDGPYDVQYCNNGWLYTVYQGHITNIYTGCGGAGATPTPPTITPSATPTPTPSNFTPTPTPSSTIGYCVGPTPTSSGGVSICTVTCVAGKMVGVGACGNNTNYGSCTVGSGPGNPVPTDEPGSAPITYAPISNPYCSSFEGSDGNAYIVCGQNIKEYGPYASLNPTGSPTPTPLACVNGIWYPNGDTSKPSAGSCAATPTPTATGLCNSTPPSCTELCGGNGELYLNCGGSLQDTGNQCWNPNPTPTPTTSTCSSPTGSASPSSSPTSSISPSASASASASATASASASPTSSSSPPSSFTPSGPSTVSPSSSGGPVGQSSGSQTFADVATCQETQYNACFDQWGSQYDCTSYSVQACNGAPPTPTPTVNPCATPTPSGSASATPSASASGTATPTLSPSASASASASSSPSASASASPSASATSSATPTPTASPAQLNYGRGSRSY